MFHDRLVERGVDDVLLWAKVHEPAAVQLYPELAAHVPARKILYHVGVYVHFYRDFVPHCMMQNEAGEVVPMEMYITMDTSRDDEVYKLPGELRYSGSEPKDFLVEVLRVCNELSSERKRATELVRGWKGT